MLRFAFILVALAGLLQGQTAQPIPAPRPNILFILIDDLGWRDVGYQGSRFYETPHVDALAKSSLVFTNGYSNGPNCAPSRACLMTGLYSPRHGIYTVGAASRGQSETRRIIPIKNTQTLRTDLVTIAEILQKAGYRTGHFGKWHLGADPTSQGFDVNVGGNKTGTPRGGHFSPYRNPQLVDGPKGEYLTQRLTREAVAFMKPGSEYPFFCYLTHYAVHTPIQAPRSLIKKYKAKQPVNEQSNARYAAMVEEMDQSVGAVVAHVRKLKRPTIVIYMSDNGGHGGVTSMSPLRGAKGMLYEGGIRVPLIINWPGQTKAGEHCDAPVIGSDLFVTIADMAQVPSADSKGTDGASLFPYLTGKKGWEALQNRPIFWHFPAYLQGLRGMKQIFRTRPVGVIRLGDYKLLQFFEDRRIELYNLKADIGEQRDLSLTNPTKAKQLLDRLHAWQKKVAAPIPTERNPDYVQKGRVPAPGESDGG